jgi:hypothetical protein
MNILKNWSKNRKNKAFLLAEMVVNKIRRKKKDVAETKSLWKWLKMCLLFYLLTENY